MHRILCCACVAVVALVASETTASAAAPDLVILGASPTGPNSVVVRVRNIGNAPSGPCRMALWVHKNSPGFPFLGGPFFVSVPALAPGQFGSVVVTTSPGVTVMPQRLLRFYIDYGNIVAESNEANNSFTLIVP